MPKTYYEGSARRKRRNRSAIGALAFLLLAAAVQNAAIFDPTRKTLHEEQLVFGAQDVTKLHYLLLERGLISAKKEQVLPSTALLPEPYKEDGVPTLSVVTGSAGLYSPVSGIFANPRKKGRNWERRAYVSYFKDGTMRYQAPIGLRVHGGTSRGGEIKSMKLIFRRSYSGTPRSEPGLFFDKESPKLQRVVLSNTAKPKRFLNPIALELAAGVGCLTSRSQPVRVFLNGERIPVGFYLLEHQSREYLKQLAGHDDYEWIRLKGNNRPSPRFNALRTWLRNYPRPMTMEEASKHFNLDDLAAWILAVSFCGTTDEDQGGYFLDRRDPNARWRCLAWDLDGSFKHGKSTGDLNFRFDVVKGIRGRLFRRLVHEDPKFHAFFRAKAQQALQGVYSPEQIHKLIDKYRAILKTDVFRGQEANYKKLLDNTEKYLTYRSAHYLAEFDKYMLAPEGPEPAETPDSSEEENEGALPPLEPGTPAPQPLPDSGEPLNIAEGRDVF